MDAIVTGAQGPQGPSLRVRLLLPAPALQRHGVYIVALPLFTAEEAAAVHRGTLRSRLRVLGTARARSRAELRRRSDATVVVIQGQLDPLPGRRLERDAIRGRELVLDVDDAIWLPQPGGHPLARLRRGAAKLRWLAGRADRVIAGNDYLADWLSTYSREVSVVPSLVDTGTVARRAHRESSSLVVGWIGSASTSRYLEAVSGPLTEFARGRPDLAVKLLVIGGTAPDVPGVKVEQHRWSEAQERAALEQMDVGLMPLPDNPWTRGKCAYKALQYMSAGVPVIADDVGLTATVIGDGDAGLLTDGPAAWMHALHRLADDANLRIRMGQLGSARVEERFSVRAWAPRLAALISGGRAAG
jgi:glycosyltransferase involved in cell wall biosynthesis